MCYPRGRLASAYTTTHTYDNNGSLSTTQVAAGTTTNTYDYENRLTLIAYSDGSTTTFTYNGAGKRLSKQDSGGTIKYMYDMDKVVLERDGQDTTARQITALQLVALLGAGQRASDKTDSTARSKRASLRKVAEEVVI